MTTEAIVRNTQGKTVGRIHNRIFVKDVIGSKHMLRQPMAWAIDADIFDRVIKPNCLAIHIIDKETGHKYITGVSCFLQHRKSLNRGFGKQYYLELIHWAVQ